jgi:hypothetical protein
MKTAQKVKTLNPESLAAGGDEGSSTTGKGGYIDSMPHGAQKIDDFFTLRYQRLSRWCHQRWNSSGGDVMNSAVVIAIEGGYTYMTFSLFRRLCREAARKLRLNHIVYTADGVIILPPTELSAQRLQEHLSVAPAGEQPEFPSDCIRAAKKLVRAEKKGQPNLWTAIGGAA